MSLTLDTRPEETPISLDPQVQDVTPMSADQAVVRADKASYGIDNAQHDEYVRMISQGHENALRTQVAADLDFKKSMQRQEIIANFARTEKGPLTLEGFQNITRPLDAQPTDPKSVFERSFSERYMSTLYDVAKNKPGSWLDDAMKEMPNLVTNEVKKGSDLLTKHQIIETRYQNAKEAEEQQSWPGYLGDSFRNAVPLVWEARMRGNVEGTSFLGGTMGHVLENQRAHLMTLPLGGPFEKALDHIEETLKDNPQAHAAFLSSMLGQSLGERSVNDAMTVLEVTGLSGIGKAVLRKIGLINQVKGVAKEMAVAAEAANFPTPKPGLAWTTPEVTDITKPRTLANDNVKPVERSAEYRAFVDDGNMEVFQTTRTAEQPEVVATAAAGDLETAAVKRFTSRVMNGFKGTVRPEKESIEAMSSVFKTELDARERGVGQMGQEIFNRMQERSKAYVGELADAVANVSKVTRLPDILSAETVSQIVKDSTKDGYRSIENRVLDYSDLYHNEATNTYHFDIALGRNTGELFHKKSEALAVAKMEGLINPNIEPKGLGYIIRLRQNLPETSPVIADYTAKLVEKQGVKTPSSWHSVVTNWIRNPDDALSKAQNENRKVVTYVPATMLGIMRNNMDKVMEASARFHGKNFYEAFANLGKWKDWDKAIKQERNEVDPATGKLGYFYKTPLELDGYYQRTFGRVPDAVETEAYFQFVDNINTFKMLRNLDAHKMASRTGAEHFSVTMLNDVDKRIQTPFFSGIRKNEFPGGEWTIAVMGRKLGEEEVYSANHMNPTTRQSLVDQVLKGEKQVIEIYDTESRPLANFSPKFKNTKIRYVISDTFEHKDLPFDLATKSAGGLIDYEFEHAIKQAKFFDEKIGENAMRRHYEGDTPITAVDHRAMGTDVIKKMTAVQKLIREGNEAGAEAAAADLPFPWEQHRSWYNPTTNADGTLSPPKLSLTEPFHIVGKDEMIVNIDNTMKKRIIADGSEFIDGTKQGSLARQNQIEFTGDRDIYETFTNLRNEGTRYNPLYKYEPAKEIDSSSTMNRALAQMVNSTFMEDYKIFSMNTWLKEASNHLKAGPDEIAYSPWHIFSEANRNSFLPDTPVAVRENLLQAKHKIDQLVGVPSWSQAILDSWAQSLADSIYNKAGPLSSLEISEKSPLFAGRNPALAPSWTLSNITSVPKFIRAATYHLVMGVFTPVQILTQHMTFATIAGISPRYAATGTYATLLDRWGSINPRMLDTLDKYATKLNAVGVQWKPGEFKEAYETMRNTGFRVVGNEHIFSDFGMPVKIVPNAGAQFLDAGQFFFKESERDVRMASWYTAFKEFRDENPVGKITMQDRNSILRRATDLSGNMDKSSKSILETGAFAPATQFLSYQIRLMDLMAGKRLDPVAKARVLALNAAAFGVPVTAGVVTLFPFGNMIREYAEKHDYHVGEKFLSSLAMEGGIASTIAALTGGGDMAKGNWYNVGPKFGAPGLDVMDKVYHGDAKLWELFGGASWSRLSSMFEATDGFRYAMMSWIRGDGKFPFIADDLIDPVRELSTANSMVRAIVANNTGKWLSKSGLVIQDKVSPLNNFFMSVTGLQPQANTDAKTLIAIQKADKDNMHNAEKLAKQEYRKFINNRMDGNEEQALKHATRARAFLIAGGIPERDWGKFVGQAAQENQEQIKRLRWESTYGKNVPTDRRGSALDSRRRENQLRGE